MRAVDGIDLTVRQGEIVALLGPNGAGKTTTLDMLLGLVEPTAGTVRVLGSGRRMPRHPVASPPSCRPEGCSATSRCVRASR